MNIKYSILLFILFFGCTKNKKATDSDKSTSDSISYYFNLSKKNNFNEKQKKQFLNQAFQRIIKSPNTKENRNKLAEITIDYYNYDLNNFNKSAQLLQKNSVSTKDSINIANAYRCKAAYFKETNLLDSSFYYYLKSEKVFPNQSDQLTLGNILLNKGIIQCRVGDFLGAEFSLSRSYSIYKDSERKDKVYGVLNQLGLVYNELEEYEKAAFYHTKALETVRKYNLQNNEHQEAVCYNNLGYLYIKQNKYKEAIINFELGLKDKFIINDDPDLYALLIDNLGYSRLQADNYENLPQLFYEALKVREKLDDQTVIVGSYIHLSEYFQKKKDYLSAIKYAEIAVKTARKSKISTNKILALKQASIVDKKKASQYSKDYIRISDSLQLAERKSRDRFSRIQLETDEIIESNTQLEERNRNLLYFFVVSAILLGFLFIIRTQRAKTRELVLKQAQQKANEDIYNLMIAQQSVIDESRAAEKKRIARELHDGVLGRMFGARLNLDSLNTSSDEDSVQKRFNYLSELKNIEQDLREISHDLNREKTVLINNFVSIVNNLLEEQKASFDAKVVSIIDESIKWNKIHNNIKINLYRILQEGLQNINKYANAKNIKVEIKSDGENVCLIVEDDGAGFEVNKKSKGIGLQNMISRTNECHGIFDIKSKKGKGTSIEIKVPYENNKITTDTE